MEARGSGGGCSRRRGMGISGMSSAHGTQHARAALVLKPAAAAGADVAAAGTAWAAAARPAGTARTRYAGVVQHHYWPLRMALRRHVYRAAAGTQQRCGGSVLYEGLSHISGAEKHPRV